MSAHQDETTVTIQHDGDEQRRRAIRPECLLDGWTGATWSGGLQIEDVPALEPLTVYTRNSVYTIVVQRPGTSDVIVRGGRLFPTFRRAVLAGACAGGSLLKMGGIYPGLCLELMVDGRRVLTSPVTRITWYPREIDDQGGPPGADGR